MSTDAPLPRTALSGVRPAGPLVLVVEDDDATRELLATQLADSGFMVLEAADGATAIDKALRFGPHAIVLDLMLPGIDGFKVARRLRCDDRTSDTPIIALTALTSKKFESIALGAGCDSFMIKPASLAVLIDEIVRLIDVRGDTPTRPDLARVAR